jgi:UDP-N-acetylenolpyruvoylglucosamine reductase
MSAKYCRIRKKVYEKFKVRIEEEIELIGDFK